MNENCDGNKELVRLLKKLGRGEVRVEEVEEPLARMVISEEDMVRCYLALSTRVWCVVAERWVDPELASWHGLILDIAFRAKSAGRLILEAQMQTLAELVQISINMSTRPAGRDLLARPDVRRIAQALQGAPEGDLSLADLASQLGSNIAPVLRQIRLLVLDGLVKRHLHGDEPRYSWSGGETA